MSLASAGRSFIGGYNNSHVLEI